MRYRIASDFQCWPDADGKHAWYRHRCRGELKVMLLPIDPWVLEGRKVVPNVVCHSCEFDENLTLTHDSDPAFGNSETWLESQFAY